ncbi:unnamed protein product [Protopolystoma xenopodis]|uniref:Serine/threonine-protein phosphatase n=1 Tax=Protopolystoma xenopodis TaxID=117903 RepID=A0A3S5CN37_9PLAT|nr:unnamed protein product [Protopolystoma xenopodis]
MAQSQNLTETRGTISSTKRQLLLHRTDQLISRLTDYQVLKGKTAQMTELEITTVCALVAEVFADEPIALDIKLEKPLYVLGDIFGQYGDLLRIFNFLGHPPAKRFLLLGNYVGRNDRSIETISLLLCYKLRYPDSIFLIRGNHECEHISRFYGFYEECMKRFSRRLWRAFTSVFDFMPLVAFIEDKIFCTHSGLMPSVHFSGMTKQLEIKDFLSQMIPRPTDAVNNVIVRNILWCEPDVECKMWDRNPAGVGYLYGTGPVDNFCERFGIQQVREKPKDQAKAVTKLILEFSSTIVYPHQKLFVDLAILQIHMNF